MRFLQEEEGVWMERRTESKAKQWMKSQTITTPTTTTPHYTGHTNKETKLRKRGRKQPNRSRAGDENEIWTDFCLSIFSAFWVIFPQTSATKHTHTHAYVCIRNSPFVFSGRVIKWERERERAKERENNCLACSGSDYHSLLLLSYSNFIVILIPKQSRDASVFVCMCIYRECALVWVCVREEPVR